jgi:5-methylcytosine-specific restriction protein A
MPTPPGILRPCSRGCGTLVIPPASRCPSCQRARDAARGTAASRGYSYAWTKLRARVLGEQPLCAHPGCMLPSVDVDHRVAKRKGGTDDRSNLIAYCHPHHSLKTTREDGGLGRLPQSSMTAPELHATFRPQDQARHSRTFARNWGKSGARNWRTPGAR